jgi:hypothetical protein
MKKAQVLTLACHEIYVNPSQNRFIKSICKSIIILQYLYISQRVSIEEQTAHKKAKGIRPFQNNPHPL